MYLKWCGIVEGIAYLHHHIPPIVHGDLKPASSFLSLDQLISNIVHQ
jgi:hypothetical protein